MKFKRIAIILALVAAMVVAGGTFVQGKNAPSGAGLNLRRILSNDPGSDSKQTAEVEEQNSRIKIEDEDEGEDELEYEDEDEDENEQENEIEEEDDDEDEQEDEGDEDDDNGGVISPPVASPTTPPPTTVPPTTPPPTMTINAAALYSNYCSSCHGSNRQNGSAPALTSSALSGKTVQQIVNTITGGKGSMPGFSGSMSAAEIGALAQWLKTAP